MFLVDQLILISAILLMVGILSSKFSARLGLPVLVLFLVVGMLAGEEGVGGIVFDNYRIAHGISSLALAIILFDGGLRTPIASVQGVWKPSLVLATAGVAATALITGVAAAFILDVPLTHGLLLGSIVGSTDAAAVFAILRGHGLHLGRRLSATLEVESGSNDPMAILLTIAMIQLIQGQVESVWSLVSFFIAQFAIGTIVGLIVGKLGAILVNRIRLEASGLYPVLTAVIGLLSFGIAANSGGSGFLAIYVAGIVLGNSNLVFQRGTLLLHDGLAWISQMTMFILLGLLSRPSELLAIAPRGLLVAGVLILVARPLAVIPMARPFRYRWNELLFIAWTGLKGAVPVILATYPLMFGVEGAQLLFNAVFFVVLVSAITQGWSLRYFADWLKVQGPAKPEPPVALEISSIRHIDGDIIDYTVEPRSRAAGRRVRELALPQDAVVALIARGTTIVPPRGSTVIMPGDHVFVVMRPGSRALVDRVFGSTEPTEDSSPFPAEFPLQGHTTVGEVADFYGIRIDAAPTLTLDQLLRQRLGALADVGDHLTVGGITLRVREVVDNHIEWVGLSITDEAEAFNAAQMEFEELEDDDVDSDDDAASSAGEPAESTESGSRVSPD